MRVNMQQMQQTSLDKRSLFLYRLVDEALYFGHRYRKADACASFNGHSLGKARVISRGRAAERIEKVAHSPLVISRVC